MILYRKIHRLLSARMAQEGLSLRGMAEESGIDYGTLWRLLKAKTSREVFQSGGGRKGMVIMNLTAETLDRLCHYLHRQPGDLLEYRVRK